jgi:hypothetical protein
MSFKATSGRTEPAVPELRQRSSVRPLLLLRPADVPSRGTYRTGRPELRSRPYRADPNEARDEFAQRHAPLAAGEGSGAGLSQHCHSTVTGLA